MTHLLSARDAGQSAIEIEAARRARLCDPEQVDVIAHDWSQMTAGIVLAGGAYPVVLSGIAAVVAIVMTALSVFSGATYGSLVSVLVSGASMLLLLAILAGMVGIIWWGLVSIVVLPVIYLFAWSLRLRMSMVWLGAFSGGMVGFVSVLSLILSWGPPIDFRYETFIVVLLGPGLGTVVGQLGGAWGGNQSREALIPKRILDGIQFSKVPDTFAVEPPRFQFGIRHLLWIVVWLSLLLSLIRVCGIPIEIMLPLVLGWLLFQLMTLSLGRWLYRRLGHLTSNVASLQLGPVE